MRGMINLVIAVAAFVIAMRCMGPIMRALLSLLMKAMTSAFYVAVALLVVVAVLTHGRFI